MIFRVVARSANAICAGFGRNHRLPPSLLLIFNKRATSRSRNVGAIRSRSSRFADSSLLSAFPISQCRFQSSFANNLGTISTKKSGTLWFNLSPNCCNRRTSSFTTTPYPDPSPKSIAPEAVTPSWHNPHVPPPANTLFRKLPSTDDVLHTRELEPLISRDGQPAVTAAIRTVLDCLREQIAASSITEKQVDLAIQGLTAAIDRELRSGLGFSLRQVINATGVILHTNLGRALLSESALDHIRET